MKRTDHHRAVLIYISPHGSTRKVITHLDNRLTALDYDTSLFDLGRLPSDMTIQTIYDQLATCSLLVVASPVYAHHPVRLLDKFLKNLPKAYSKKNAALVATFGGVSTGMVFYDMTSRLREKGYRVISALKVLTEHCLTFQNEEPFMKGHPDEEDLEITRGFAERIVQLNRQSDPPDIKPGEFNDLPIMLRLLDRTVINMVPMDPFPPPVRVVSSRCISCRSCADQCPAGNISIAPYPILGRQCTFCFHCLRVCPEGALQLNLAGAKATIQNLAAFFQMFELQQTRIVL